MTGWALPITGASSAPSANLTKHIKRYGDYIVDMNRVPKDISVSRSLVLWIPLAATSKIYRRNFIDMLDIGRRLFAKINKKSVLLTITTNGLFGSERHQKRGALKNCSTGLLDHVGIIVPRPAQIGKSREMMLW